jgi:hypothetical protein
MTPRLPQSSCERCTYERKRCAGARLLVDDSVRHPFTLDPNARQRSLSILPDESPIVGVDHPGIQRLLDAPHARNLLAGNDGCDDQKGPAVERAALEPVLSRLQDRLTYDQRRSDGQRGLRAVGMRVLRDRAKGKHENRKRAQAMNTRRFMSCS